MGLFYIVLLVFPPCTLLALHFYSMADHDRPFWPGHGPDVGQLMQARMQDYEAPRNTVHSGSWPKPWPIFKVCYS